MEVGFFVIEEVDVMGILFGGYCGMSKEKDFSILKKLYDELDLFFQSAIGDTQQEKLPSSTNQEDSGGGEESPPSIIIRDPNKPASIPQKKKLRYLGYKGDVDSLKMGEASDLIKKLEKED